MKRNLLLLLPVLAGLAIWYLMDTTQKITSKNTSNNQIAVKSEYKKKRAKDDFKFDHPDLYRELHRKLRTGAGENAPSYPANYQMIELRKAQSRNKAYRTENNNFKERGPGNVPGRSRALVVHPEDPKNTWYSGAAGGGIWKSTDAGVTWKHLTESLPTLSVASLAISQSNPNVLYAGTGEVFFSGGSGVGFGIFKSEDGGENWQQLESTAIADFQNVSRIIVDPNNENVLLASAGPEPEEGVNLRFSATNSKIFKSTDGGNSWTELYDSPRPVYQLVAKPDDFNTIYATVQGTGVIWSTDGGQTWENRANGIGLVGRTEIAISENNPNVLYASAEGSLTGNTGDLYYTNDAGANWKLLIPSIDEVNHDLLGGQGDYDNTILINPFNDDIVYLGGVNTYKAQLSNGPDSTISTLLGTETESADGFLQEEVRTFIDEGVEITPEEFVGVEIRFGADLSQKAYRFSVPEGRTSGVAPEDYTYQNIIDVPFEVWDTKNNRQLAVSVRDQLNDGAFNLKDNFNDSREYIFVHALPYSETPDENITENGGHTYKNMYLLWVSQPVGTEWDVNAIPTGAKINVNYGDLIAQPRITTVITDQYGELDQEDEAFRRNAWRSSFGAGIHPDMHQLIAIKGDNANEFQILSSTDGGMYLSNMSIDPGVQDSSWTMRGNTYNTSQFYGISKVPNQEHYLGGMQDNGTWLFGGNNIFGDRALSDEVADANDEYFIIWGGDGFECQWHATEDRAVLFSAQFNGIGKFDLSGGLRNATTGMTDFGDGLGPFVTRLAYTKSDPDLVFTIGASGVWRSDNFADSWELAPIPTQWYAEFGGDVDVSPANPQIVWAGGGMSEFQSLFLSKDGGLSFTTIPDFDEIGSISGIYTHPTEEGTAFVLFSAAKRAKILRTKDFGETWEDISGFHESSTSTGFADVPTYSVMVMPHDTQRIWAGTEIGIFESTDEGKTWNLLSDFPNVSVWDMRAEENEIVIGTHGRGIWTATIEELTTAPTPEVTLAPRLNSLSQVLSTGTIVLGMNIDLRSRYDSVQILRDGERIDALGRNIIPRLDLDYEFETGEFDSTYVQVVAYRAGVSYKSSILSMSGSDVIQFGESRTEYETTFDDGKEGDFFNAGFRIGEEDGFTGSALHSDHPYLSGSDIGLSSINYISTLVFPIEVAPQNALMRFNEVALVEIGEAGTVFGDEEFWDYVIVEGSTDLVNWQPLLDGYDANADGAWLDAYNAGSRGDESMFRERVIDLGGTFQAGDVVFIRFRLFSDPAAIGFGWVIDDLEIQTEELVSSTEESALINAVSVYPNPAPNGVFNLTINNVLGTNLTVKVYDSAGKLVHRQQAQRQGLFFNQKIQLQNAPKGVYVVEVNDGTQRVTKKLVVK